MASLNFKLILGVEALFVSAVISAVCENRIVTTKSVSSYGDGETRFEKWKWLLPDVWLECKISKETVFEQVWFSRYDSEISDRIGLNDKIVCSLINTKYCFLLPFIERSKQKKICDRSSPMTQLHVVSTHSLSISSFIELLRFDVVISNFVYSVSIVFNINS